MKQLKTKAIILARRNYRETDRILTVLSPDYGKFSLIAKGARSMKSKLAGSIELFTVNDIGFIKGRGDLATLISGRLEKNYPNIIKEISRVQLGYEILKTINKTTESEAEAGYFLLLKAALEGLDDLTISNEVNHLWFMCQLIGLSGHTPNLVKDNKGKKLIEAYAYGFDNDTMSFFVQSSGKYDGAHIKFLRLAFGEYKPSLINRVNGSSGLSEALLPLIGSMRIAHLIG